MLSELGVVGNERKVSSSRVWLEMFSSQKFHESSMYYLSSRPSTRTSVVQQNTTKEQRGEQGTDKNKQEEHISYYIF